MAGLLYSSEKYNWAFSIISSSMSKGARLPGGPSIAVDKEKQAPERIL